jgi:TonB-linked SusC/RagA family outer membrane protein
MRRILMLIVLMICVVQVFAQTRTVTGVVTSKEDGQTVPGVNVSIKGTTSGTVTDLKGYYSIKVDSSSTLVFTFIGYQTVEIRVKDQEEINLAMEAETKAIDELVVIGYGTQKKSHLTGSVSKFKDERLDETSVSRLDQALQGKIAGVQIQNTTSEVGVAPVVRIRGMGSVSANSSPLVVVDGHPVDDGLSYVNMADVESIEVLKDASSAAIYGSRGANGVIIITTKTGIADKPKYTFKTQYGVRSAYELHKIMSTSDYIKLMYSEAALRLNDPNAPTVTIADGDKAGYVIEQSLRNGESTNWQDQAIRKIAQTRNFQMSVSGGKKDLTYYISANIQNDEGQMYHSTYDKMGLVAKIGGNLTKKVKFNININPTYSNTERPSENYTDFIRFSSWLPVRHTEATAAFARQNPIYANVQAGDWAQVNHFASQMYSGTMPDGSTWGPILATPSTSANQSPKSSLERNSTFQRIYRMVNSADITVTLRKGLTFKTSGSAYLSYTENTDNSLKNATKEGDPSIRVFGSILNTDVLSENTLNYNRSFGNHDITTLIGYTMQSRQNMLRGISASGFPSDDITSIIGQSQVSLNGTYTSAETIRLMSYLSRVNYSFKGKYLLSASIRTDGSSYFSAGNRWGWFPAISAGWKASEESFLKKYSWLSNLKLRTSYGATGNNRIQNYSWTNLLYGLGASIGSGTGQTIIGLTPNNDASANRKITWERTFEYNGGMDLGFLKDRISLTFEYFNAQTDKLLFQQAAMAISGYNLYWNNIGKVKNSGVEIELTTVNLSGKDLSWKTSFNISKTENKLLELGGEPHMYTYGERNEMYAAIVGQPAIQFFGYKTNGIFLTQAEVDAAQAADQGTTVPNYFSAGGLKTVDTNGDGKITTDDRVPLGNPFPKFTWGMTNTLKYKGFDLNILIQGVSGNKVLNGEANYVENRRIDHAYSDGRWISDMYPGNGKTPYGSNGQNWMLTDYVIEDGSYFALRDLSLGYELPSKISKRLNLSSLRIHISCQNLLYVWAKNYRGINPEARMKSGLYNTPLVDGYQRGAFPVARTISSGLEINF